MADGRSRRLKLAVLADVQYADIDDQRGRRYRNTLDVARRAVEYFNRHEDLDLLLHAGDIIDFNNTSGAFAHDGGQATKAALGAVMSILSQARCPRFLNLIGNHELYNWSREQLLQGVPWEAPGNPSQNGVLHHCPEGSSEFYHSFCPCDGWRFVVLDPYDVSIYRKGRTAADPPYNFDFDATALAELCKHNPAVKAFVEQRPGENILTPYWAGSYWETAPREMRRWVPFNGRVGAQQLQWLGAELEAAASRGERVAVLSHVLIHPESCPSNCETLLWNYDEVLAVLQSAAGRAVEFVLSGHDHPGGSHTDELGIHYLVVESPLSSGEGQPGCFFVLEAGETLELSGYCNARSTLFPGCQEGAPCHRSLPLRGARRP